MPNRAKWSQTHSRDNYVCNIRSFLSMTVCKVQPVILRSWLDGPLQEILRSFRLVLVCEQSEDRLTVNSSTYYDFNELRWSSRRRMRWFLTAHLRPLLTNKRTWYENLFTIETTSTMKNENKPCLPIAKRQGSNSTKGQFQCRLCVRSIWKWRSSNRLLLHYWHCFGPISKQFRREFPRFLSNLPVQICPTRKLWRNWG